MPWCAIKEQCKFVMDTVVSSIKALFPRLNNWLSDWLVDWLTEGAWPVCPHVYPSVSGLSFEKCEMKNGEPGRSIAIKWRYWVMVLKMCGKAEPQTHTHTRVYRHLCWKRGFTNKMAKYLFPFNFSTCYLATTNFIVFNRILCNKLTQSCVLLGWRRIQVLKKIKNTVAGICI